MVSWALLDDLGGLGQGLGDLGVALDGADAVAGDHGRVGGGDDGRDVLGGRRWDLGGGVDGFGYDFGFGKGFGDGLWDGGADCEGFGVGLCLVLLLAG